MNNQNKDDRPVGNKQAIIIMLVFFSLLVFIVGFAVYSNGN